MLLIPSALPVCDGVAFRVGKTCTVSMFTVALLCSLKLPSFLLAIVCVCVCWRMAWNGMVEVYESAPVAKVHQWPWAAGFSPIGTTWRLVQPSVGAWVTLNSRVLPVNKTFRYIVPPLVAADACSCHATS